MKLGLSLTQMGRRTRIDLESVQLAEQLGYDVVWASEAWGSDPSHGALLCGCSDRADKGGLSHLADPCAHACDDGG